MKIVIIGGVAGGASAAARARRLDEKAEIILLQSGPDVSFASCGMPYYIGGEIRDRSRMAVQTPASLKDTLNIEVRVNTRADAIDVKSKIVTARNEQNGEVFTANYDNLILAVGASPLRPPIPGIDRPGLYALRNLDDMDTILAWILKKLAEHDEMHCVVAGAGFVGLEMVEQLVRRKIRVSIVEMLPQVLGPLDIEMAAVIQNELTNKGVTVITGDGIAEFRPADGDSDSSIVVLKSGRTLPAAQMTILGLGVKPDTEIAKKAGIEVTPRGHIVVDDQLRTSVTNVWAVGDAIEVRNPILGGDEMWSVPLAGPANRQGRMVADNIYGKGKKFKGTYGASVVRVFELMAACVGISEKTLVAKKLPFATVHVHPNSHASYFPGAKSINFKLLFNPKNGQIYGAQAVGADGVEKRIDVISTAMQGKLTVDDLADLELCYAPPVGSAKDPVNMAGMAAQNLMEGMVSQIDWKELDAATKDPEIFVLDVRTPNEINALSALPGTHNIPLPQLRGRLDEIPNDKHVLVTCRTGQRAYYASRILSQSGFGKVDILSGAYLTYSVVKALG